MGVFDSLYRALHPVYSKLRSHPGMISLLFHVRVPPGPVVHWDTTTLLLKNSLKKVMKKQDAVLEIGVGQAALLSIWIQKKLKPRILHGVDVSLARVESSRRTAEYNGIDSKIWQSNLFSNVDSNYDLIFFNPPYVRTSIGKSLDLTKRLSADGDQVWDGGEMGTDVIQKFLAHAGNHLVTSGRILLGVQDFYVKHEQIAGIAKQYGFVIVDSYSAFMNPSVVYLLKRD